MVLLLGPARFTYVCSRLDVDGLTHTSGRWLAVDWGYRDMSHVSLCPSSNRLAQAHSYSSDHRIPKKRKREQAARSLEV